MKKGENLYNNLKRLTGIEPPNRLWEKIIEEISYNELNRVILKDKIKYLPVKDPPSFIWDNIIKNSIRRIKFKSFLIRTTSIAASVILLVGLSIIYINKYLYRNKIQLTEETIQLPNKSLPINIPVDASVFIKDLCEVKKLTCQEGNLKSLIKELEFLDNELKELKQSGVKSQYDETFYYYVSKVETQRYEVFNEIMESII